MIIDGLIVKIAQRCNLACSYCYMYEHVDQSFKSKPPVMSEAILAATLLRTREYLDQHPGHKLSVTLHGGEPTLVGQKRFRRYAETIREGLGEGLSGLMIQTNATLLDDGWPKIFQDLNIEIGVSLDGSPQSHDRYRVDHFGAGSYERTVAGIQRLHAADIFPSIICVIEPGADGAAAYKALRDIGIERMDFLLPDVTHETKEEWFPGYKDGVCAAYLIGAFDAWLAEDNPKVVVRVFRDVISMAWGKKARTELMGNPSINYVVVDTDGNIQGNDALRICEPKLCDTELNVQRDGFGDLAKGSPFIVAAMEGAISPSPTCLACRHLAVCGGGNMPHRYSRSNGFRNPSAWCEDLKIFCDHVQGRLLAEAC